MGEGGGGLEPQEGVLVETVGPGPAATATAACKGVVFVQGLKGWWWWWWSVGPQLGPDRWPMGGRAGRSQVVFVSFAVLGARTYRLPRLSISPDSRLQITFRHGIARAEGSLPWLLCLLLVIAACPRPPVCPPPRILGHVRSFALTRLQPPQHCSSGRSMLCRLAGQAVQCLMRKLRNPADEGQLGRRGGAEAGVRQVTELRSLARRSSPPDDPRGGG